MKSEFTPKGSISVEGLRGKNPQECTHYEVNALTKIEGLIWTMPSQLKGRLEWSRPKKVGNNWTTCPV
jgi:hypothetical protein